MPGIKATHSKNLTVKDCKFSGFDTDIELENVEGFLSESNEFSIENNPSLLLSKMIDEIKKSSLDECSQERLFKEIIEFLADSKNKSVEEKKNFRTKILEFVGDKIANYFVQLAAAVSTGLIITKK